MVRWVGIVNSSSANCLLSPPLFAPPVPVRRNLWNLFQSSPPMQSSKVRAAISLDGGRLAESPVLLLPVAIRKKEGSNSYIYYL